MPGPAGIRKPLVHEVSGRLLISVERSGETGQTAGVCAGLSVLVRRGSAQGLADLGQLMYRFTRFIGAGRRSRNR